MNELSDLYIEINNKDLIVDSNKLRETHLKDTLGIQDIKL
jgi:hypothetical protein